MTLEMTDFIIRCVAGYGFLPIIRDVDNQEIYRGEFQDTAQDALQCCLDAGINEEIKPVDSSPYEHNRGRGNT
tara:strand:- start:168 stop:386 length:219 start_codon:yes stop_codon:yes gene_type:complete